MLRALYKSPLHKSRFLQSLLLLPSSPPRHHLNNFNFIPTQTTTRHSTFFTHESTKVLLPCATNMHLRPPMHPFLNGEGSWNVSWDARPARWLYRPDSALFMFGLCSYLSSDNSYDDVVEQDELVSFSNSTSDASNPNYKITGVLADGRCLFRAIAHGACLSAGEEKPDEEQQTRLADELRAQVVIELLKRRKESEWYIEGDFDEYVKRMEQSHVWGGEPELLMASHVLQTPICVFMMDSKSQKLTMIAKYGGEYNKIGDNAINVLFHGYGHYDLVETI